MNELPAISAHIIAAIADFLEAPQYQVALWDSRLVDYFHSHPFEQFQGSRHSQFAAWLQAVKTVAKTS